LPVFEPKKGNRGPFFSSVVTNNEVLLLRRKFHETGALDQERYMRKTPEVAGSLVLTLVAGNPANA
jgi:hypothetical protein